MKKRISIKIGDVFEVLLSGGLKRYFQYILDDSAQLDSNVIRTFRKRYPSNAIPNLEDIVDDEVEHYFHVFVKIGHKDDTWNKVGNVPVEKNLVPPCFRVSGDHGNPNVKVSHNWYVWRANDAYRTHVGELKGEYQSFDLGPVWPPEAVREILETGKSSWFYPGF